MRQIRNSFFPYLALLIVSSVFYYQVGVFGNLPVPTDTLVGLYHPWRDAKAGEYPRGIPYKNFLITDPVRQQIPWRKLVVDSLKVGTIPKTNFFSFSSSSLIGNIQAGTFYPFNVLFLFLPFYIAWTILVMLQTVLSLWFMFMFLKRLGLGSSASFLGSICWGFSGFSIAWLTWGTIGHTILWLPLQLYCIESLSNKSLKRRDSVLLSVLFIVGLSFSFFAGHSQVWLYSQLLIFSYGVYKVSLLRNAKKKQSIVVASTVYCISILVISIQLFPFYSTLLESSRLFESSVWKNEGWFIPWQNLIQFFIPDFFGNPATLNYWGIWNYGEFIGYIGVVGIFFAVIGILRKSVPSFWIIVLFLCLLFALPTYISYLPYYIKLPFFSSIQPTRLLSVIVFSLCILAAYGYDSSLRVSTRITKKHLMYLIIFIVVYALILVTKTLSNDQELIRNLQISLRNTVPQIFFVALFSVFLFLRNYLPERVFVFGVMAVCLVDLFRFGWKFTPFTQKEYFFPQTRIISYLKDDKDIFRVMTTDARILPANTNAYYGIASISGYDPIYNSRYEEYIAASERGNPNIARPFGFNRIIEPKNYKSPLLASLNVKYVLTFDSIADENYEEVMTEGQTKLYKKKKYLPRAYIAEKVITEKNSQRMLEALFSQTTSSPVYSEENISVNQKPLDTVETIESYEINSKGYTARVSVSENRLVVLSEIYSSGTEVFLNQKKVPTYRVNYILTGVVVPKGTHALTVL